MIARTKVCSGTKTSFKYANFGFIFARKNPGSYRDYRAIVFETTFSSPPFPSLLEFRLVVFPS